MAATFIAQNRTSDGYTSGVQLGLSCEPRPFTVYAFGNWNGALVWLETTYSSNPGASDWFDLGLIWSANSVTNITVAGYAIRAGFTNSGASSNVSLVAV